MPQLRHQVISGILALQVSSFRKWLETCSADLIIAVWAAMGHHLKIGLSQDDQSAEFIVEILSLIRSAKHMMINGSTGEVRKS